MKVEKVTATYVNLQLTEEEAIILFQIVKNAQENPEPPNVRKFREDLYNQLTSHTVS